MVGFASSVVVGLAVGLEPITILTRALLVMFIAYAFGRIIGAIAQRIVDDHIAQYKQSHPIRSIEELTREQGNQASTTSAQKPQEADDIVTSPTQRAA